MAQAMSEHSFASLMELAFPTSLDEASADCRRCFHGFANCVDQFVSSLSRLFTSADMGQLSILGYRMIQTASDSLGAVLDTNQSTQTH